MQRATLPGTAFLADKFEIAAMVIFVIIVCCVYMRYPSAEEMEELNDIMMYFHKDPDFDDFCKVFNAREKLFRHSSAPKYWFYGVYLVQPQFYDAGKLRELHNWMGEIERGIRRVGTQPTARLLDNVWAIYFATGNTEYSDVVKNIARDPNINYVVRDAARWSYRSIMNQDVTDVTDVAKEVGGLDGTTAEPHKDAEPTCA